ncbi:MAG: hypothetical protein IJA97_01225 [Clostridia bacterium]|nr:hypothetical protein [Clostridia bacterium]
MIITFCGHADFIEEAGLKDRILKIIAKFSNNCSVDFYLGEYGNFDYFAKTCAYEYKKTFKDSKMYYITPYLNANFDNKNLSLFDGTIYPEIENTPLRYAILRRNEWMVDKAHLVIAYVSRGFGGAYKTLMYAKRRGKKIVNIFEDREK